MSVNKSYLPAVDSPEWEKLAGDYPDASRTQLEIWASQFGYSSIHNFMGAMRKIRGIGRANPEPILGDRLREMPVVELPPIKLREYKAKKTRRGDEEEAVLQGGDGHAGKITKSFDEDVYLECMDTMFDSTMTLVALHRNMYPINTLHIVALGDNVQGENPFQGSKVGSIRMGVRDQIAKLAFPAWVKLICSLKQEFAQVIFDGFPGNHGHDRLAPETSRADLSLYDLIDAKIGDKKGITINIHETSGEIIEIGGFRVYCFHGDEIPCQQGVPHFALAKKLKAWFIQFGGFNYALGAHFHKRIVDEIASQLEYSMSSTLVSDDDWAIKKLGISSSPSQNLFGVHPQMGMTWRYKMVVNKSFLMAKLPDTYGKEIK